jgi:hypothetical protein
MIIEVYERDCDQDAGRFWQRFSKRSINTLSRPTLKRMTFMEIVNQIRRDRRAREAEDVVKIRAALSAAEFASIFTYRKGSQERMMTKNDVILRHFRKLQSRGAAPSIPGLTMQSDGEEDGEEVEGQDDGLERR